MYNLAIGSKVKVISTDCPYTPDRHVGKTGTITRIVDGAWGERCDINVDDSDEKINVGTFQVRGQK